MKKSYKNIIYFCIIILFASIVGCKNDSAFDKTTFDNEVSKEKSEVEQYDFIDTIIEQAIRDELQIDGDYPITQSDLDRVKELRIDNRYRTWIVDMDSKNSEFLLVIDLSDLSKLTNLETLIIENTNKDYITNLSAIKECKKLKSFTMFYFESDYESNMGFGQNDLLEIISSCPNLTYLNTQKKLSDSLYKQINDINSSIITFAPAGDEYSYFDGNRTIVLNNCNQYVTEFEIYDDVKVVKIFDDESLNKAVKNENVEHIILSCYDVDINKIKDKKNLRSLTFVFPKSGRTSNQPIIRNFDSLKSMNQLRNLYFLPASGFGTENKMIIDGDVNIINDMHNLKRLGIYTENFELLDLDGMSNLEYVNEIEYQNYQ